MAVPDTIYCKEDAKYFVPLENNPEVFTTLLRSLSVPPTLTLHDIYSLDPEDLAHIPRPAHALLFIAPSPLYHEHRDQDPVAKSVPLYTSSGSDEPIYWFRQTIGNACGLIATIHALANGSAREHVPKDSELSALLEKAVDLPPKERAQLLYDAEFLERAHADAAGLGDTEAPDARAETPFHYIAYAKGKDGHLWELEGAWNGPIDRGSLEEGEDVLSAEAIRKGPGGFLELAKEGGGWFSCVALCSD